jgi:hypothetical protein
MQSARAIFANLILAGTAAAAATTTTGARTGSAGTATGQQRLRLHRDQAFALRFLARELAGAADGFGFFAGAPLGGLLIMSTQLHFAEDAFALHLLLQRLERLIDIIVANENLHVVASLVGWISEIGLGRGPI